MKPLPLPMAHDSEGGGSGEGASPSMSPETLEVPHDEQESLSAVMSSDIDSRDPGIVHVDRMDYGVCPRSCTTNAPAWSLSKLVRSVGDLVTVQVQ